MGGGSRVISGQQSITRTGIKSRMSAILDENGQFALESSHSPIMEKINVVSMIGPSPFIGSSSNLQVTRTGIKYWTSMNSGQIGLFTSELLALDCRKTPYLTLSEA